MIKKEKSKLRKNIEVTLLIVIAIIQIYPLFWLITFSLKTNQEIFGGNPLGLPEKNSCGKKLYGCFSRWTYRYLFYE